MYEFWFKHIKEKCDNKAKLCYNDTDSFIIHIEIENVFKDVLKGVKQVFV